MVRAGRKALELVVDYLYVSTTNSSAFSPTDTMPLTSRVKMLMAVQATAALITSLLVIARAVSALGGGNAAGTAHVVPELQHHCPIQWLDRPSSTRELSQGRSLSSAKAAHGLNGARMRGRLLRDQVAIPPR